MPLRLKETEESMNVGGKDLVTSVTGQNTEVHAGMQIV